MHNLEHDEFDEQIGSVSETNSRTKTIGRKQNGASLGPVWLSSSLISPSRNSRQSDSLYHAL